MILRSQEKQSNEKKPLKLSVITFLQSLYLTVAFYFKNDLVAYASNCAFGFLFSFIPVVMMILVILIRFLHASPEMLSSLFGENAKVLEFLNLQSVANTIQQIKTVTNFEIVIGISIIWMARRFFSAITGALNKIFRTEIPVRPVMTQVIVLAIEAVLTILISIIIFVLLIFKTVIKLPIINELEQAYPRIMGIFSARLVSTLPFAIIFIMSAVCYREISRTKPKLSMCMLSALLCTLTYMGFQKITGIFIDMNRYNIIYGVLSNTIVLLMEVFFFFMIFLFFGQFLFVYEYFDTLLLSELYLLPDYDDTRIFESFRRVLFIRPDSLIKKNKNIINLKKGEHLYYRGDEGKCAYYVVHGTVQVQHVNNITFVERGQFFGEEACILDEIRNDDAIAYTDVKLIQISEDTFFSVLEKNPSVNLRAMAQISHYFAKFYGRMGDYPI